MGAEAEKGSPGAQIIRLSCRDGRIVRDYGALTLYGRLESMMIGQRTFAAAQVDFARLSGGSNQADT